MSTTSQTDDPVIPILDVINEIDLLLSDYKAIKGAPKEVEDALTDIKYMGDTLNHLEELFGDQKFALHLPEPG